MYIQHFLVSSSLCRIIKSVALAACAASLLTVCAVAQNNPVPQIVGPVHPMAVAPGGEDFTLSVYGANFVPGAVVNWNYKPRATTYVSGHELQAQILSTDIAKNTAGYITVTNPAPGGGSSSASWAQVEVHEPISTVVVNPPVYYGFGFWTLQAADFNHDGILDLAGQYWGLGLEKGKGDGTFFPGTLVSPKFLPTTTFVYGDFNGDGNLDLVFDEGNQNTNRVEHLGVMLGNGKGGFSTGFTVTDTHGALGQIAVGDFNRDGKLDLMTSGPSHVSVFLGNGTGSFQPPVYYPYWMVASTMLVGDFNGDGILDVVFYGLGPKASGLAFWFLEGKGDGTFKPLREAGSVSGTSGCHFGATAQLGDFNGDGKLDLAFCNESEVGVMLGNGDGTFQAPIYYTADSSGFGQFTFAVGDINSDGKPDLLVSEYQNFNNPQFAILLGNGDGTFQQPQMLSEIESELGITVGDFNSDGLLDFIFQSDQGMHVFLQQ